MANDDIATGHNVKLDDDDFVIDPSKLKSRRNKDAPVASSSPTVDTTTQPTVTAATTPPPAPVTPSATITPPPVSMPTQNVTVVDVNTNMNNNNMNQLNYMQTQATAQAQANASVGLAQTNIDEQLIQRQFNKEDEHWVKSFWRPAMGWLYMLICFMDFVGFPLLTIFLPIIFKPFGLVMPYTAWVSLTLSNGGLIHLAFGAILGVSAFTRGQEKIAQGK